MLIYFKVNNYLSFNNDVEFNMTSTNNDHLNSHRIKLDEDTDVLKASIFYGANASGKSNLIKSIEFMKDMILGKKDIENGIDRAYFKLDETNNDKATEMTIAFSNNEKQYEYGFNLNSEKILNEYLSETTGDKENCLFKRKTTDNGENKIENSLDIKDKTHKQDLDSRMRTTPINKLILNELRSTPLKKYFENIYNWFETKLIIVFPESSTIDFIESLLKPDFNEQVSNLLQQFNVGIEKIYSKLFPVESIFTELPEEMKIPLKNSVETSGNVIITPPNGEKIYLRKNKKGKIESYKIKAGHKTFSDNIIDFELTEESDGTRRLLDLIPALISLLSEDSVFIIDEIGRSLHPELVHNFVETFLSVSDKNKTNSQLIASTHDTILLDLKLLRKDEIWFVEKNKKGESSVYSLAEFKPEYDENNLQKGYMQGRFGAIPIFKDKGWLDE